MGRSGRTNHVAEGAPRAVQLPCIYSETDHCEVCFEHRSVGAILGYCVRRTAHREPTPRPEPVPFEPEDNYLEDLEQRSRWPWWERNERTD